MISGRAAAVISAPLLAATLVGCSGDDGMPVQGAAERLASLADRVHGSLDRVSPETVPWSVSEDVTELRAGGCPSGRRYARYLATVDQAVSPTGETRSNRETLVVGVLSGDWKLTDASREGDPTSPTTLSFTARGDNPGGLRLHVTIDRRGDNWHVVVDGRTACLHPGKG